VTGRVHRLVRRPGASLLAAALVLAGLGVTADLTAPQEPAAGTATPAAAARPAVQVARADAACPDPAADDRTETRVSLAAPGAVGDDAGGGAGAPGRARLAQLTGVPRDATDVTAPGAASVLAVADQGPLVARATGDSAPGMAAGMLTRSTADTARGLAGTTCAVPGTDFWFVGSGAVVGQRGRVYLTNPEAAPAVVDITLSGPDGPIDAPAGRGVPVAAGAQVVRLLDALAPGVTRFAVHVHARSGRIAAAVRDQQVDGLTPRGADWLPPAAAPARHQALPGVVAGAGERLLQVVAPGESDAIVKVRLVTESGTFAPSGLDVIEVPAGSVAEVDLAPVTESAAVAVLLDADVPVTAGVLTRVTGTTGQLTDVAYTAAALPLVPTNPGVVPEARQGTGVTSSLLLAAPGTDATVRLAALPPATGSAVDVRVPGGSQVVVDLATVSTAPDFALTVTPRPGSGPVLAARAVAEAEARGPLLSTELVEPGRYTVVVPRVVADVSAGLRPRG
jgi:hypothetical protein